LQAHPAFEAEKIETLLPCEAHDGFFIAKFFLQR
jgi:hypothetical protein